MFARFLRFGRKPAHATISADEDLFAAWSAQNSCRRGPQTLEKQGNRLLRPPRKRNTSRKNSKVSPSEKLSFHKLRAGLQLGLALCQEAIDFCILRFKALVLIAAVEVGRVGNYKLHSAPAKPEWSPHTNVMSCSLNSSSIFGRLL